MSYQAHSLLHVAFNNGQVVPTAFTSLLRRIDSLDSYQFGAEKGNPVESRRTMKITISDIQVGERRREDLGDINALATSINSWGLLHPIVIDDKNRLVAGERRLRACQQLGWEKIEVKQLANLTTDELREIELEENMRRKDLTSLELSKNMNELARLKAEKPKTCLRTNHEPPKTMSRGDRVSGEEGFHEARKNLGGRPPKDVISEAQIAEEIGVPLSTLRDAKAHVAAVEKYPVLEPLPKIQAIQAAKQLNTLPEHEREELVKQVQDHNLEVQEIGRRKLDHINKVYDVKKVYSNAFYGVATLYIDDEHLSAWLENMLPDKIQEQEQLIEDGLKKLTSLREHLKKILGGPRLVKIGGGKQ